jgi:hypothetical protein
MREGKPAPAPGSGGDAARSVHYLPALFTATRFFVISKDRIKAGVFSGPALLYNIRRREETA